MTFPEKGMRGILFDLGGVLIEHPVGNIIRYCALHLKVDPERLLASHRRHGDGFQTGRVSEEAYWKGVCAELGVSPPGRPSLWGEAFAHAYCECEEIFRLVATLRGKGYRVGLLSDTEKPSVEFFLGRRCDHFDSLTFSCLEGAVKPRPEIYRIALQRSGTEPWETVFIDDKPENVKGAIQVGMQGILFESPRQVRQALKDIGIETD